MTWIDVRRLTNLIADFGKNIIQSGLQRSGGVIFNSHEIGKSDSALSPPFAKQLLLLQWWSHWWPETLNSGLSWWREYPSTNPYIENSFPFLTDSVFSTQFLLNLSASLLV